MFSVSTLIFLGTIMVTLFGMNVADNLGPIFFGVYAITVLLPSEFIIEIGFPFARYASPGWWRFPELTTVGWGIMLFLNLVVYYLLASVISKIWYVLKMPTESRKKRENFNQIP